MAHTSPTEFAGTLTVRPGASRSLLAKKARQNARRAEQGEPIEAAFPISEVAVEQGTSAAKPDNAGSPSAVARQTAVAATEGSHAGVGADQATTVSDDAYTGDQAGAGAGPLRRGAPSVIATQQLTLGTNKPNPGTVFAIIAGIVQERGQLTRAALIDAMPSTAFPQAKARPEDKAWCQGYVAGALRGGFLAEVEASDAPVHGEHPSNLQEA
jgi:hypothetical protein